jgi:hypothetical protein
MGFILMAATGLAMLVLVSTAVAQQGTSTSPAASQSQAPVGHRQPKPKDVPAEPRGDQAIKDMDRSLDKALKSICRGC